MSKETPLAKVIFDKLRRHLAPKPQAEGESDAAYTKRVNAALRAICGKNAEQITRAHGWDSARNAPTFLKLIEGAVALRWNSSHHTFLSFIYGRRFPTHTKNPGFFPDLKTYEHAVFDESDAVVQESLGKGMEWHEYLDSRQAGGTLRRAV